MYDALLHFLMSVVTTCQEVEISVNYLTDFSKLPTL